MNRFDYELAYSRNIGWVTQSEQQEIRNKTIAIAGMGGVGGVHLTTLCRMGFTNFHIADFDQFDVANINRQAGAFQSSLGKDKVRVMESIVKDINPEANVKVFPKGITDENMQDFFKGVDLYIDGLDFFVLEVRDKVFRHCEKMKIPGITAAPIGMGVAVVNFIPGKMSFEDYFGLGDSKDFADMILRFAIGLSPKMIHRKNIVDLGGGFSYPQRKAASSAMGCQLASGVAVTEAVKILLGRGKLYAAPWALHFDAFSNEYVKTYTIGGKRNPLLKLKLAIARKFYMSETKGIEA
ncbi:MAG: ThiF family adenylyltransferase [Bdellovibrionota bacterium]|nr:ThiF family adenylyltransferase [Bdellovibrionota bacterium]